MAEKARVLRGTISVASGSTAAAFNATLSPAVDPTRAVVSFSIRESANSQTLDKYGFRAQFSADGGTLTFTRGDTSFSPAIAIEWEVVELAAGYATVQHGTIDMGAGLGGATPVTATLATAVDPSRTIWVINWSDPGTIRCLVRPVLAADGASIDFYRADTSSTTTVRYQLVEFASGVASVQHGVYSYPGTDEGTSVAPITPVSNLARSFVGHATSHTENSRQYARAYLSDASHITFDRNPLGTTSTMPVSYYVCEFLDNTNVQAGQATIPDLTGSITGSLSPPVATARSIAFSATQLGNHSQANNGTTESTGDGNSLTTVQLSGTVASTVALQRSTTTNDLKVAWQVIEWNADVQLTEEIVHDDFARLAASEFLSTDPIPSPLDTPGNNWNIVTGDTGTGFKGATGGGALLCGPQGNASASIGGIDVGTPQQRVRVSQTSLSSTTEGFILARATLVSATGADWNGYTISWGSGSSFGIGRYNAGTFTNLQTITSYLAEGTFSANLLRDIEFEVFTNADGNVELTAFVGGRQIGPVYVDSSASKITTGDNVMIRAPFQTFTLDDFRVYSAPAASGVLGDWTPSGGVVFAGVAPRSQTKVPSVSGGVAFSGVAPRAWAKAPPSSGGLVLSGSAPRSWTKIPPASGGAVFGGAAATSFTGLLNKSWAPSGGVALSGSAAHARSWAHAASGGLALSGAAATVRAWAPASSGGIAFSGAAGLGLVWDWRPSGGASFSGQAVSAFAPFRATPLEAVLARTVRLRARDRTVTLEQRARTVALARRTRVVTLAPS